MELRKTVNIKEKGEIYNLYNDGTLEVVKKDRKTTFISKVDDIYLLENFLAVLYQGHSKYSYLHLYDSKQSFYNIEKKTCTTTSLECKLM